MRKFGFLFIAILSVSFAQQNNLSLDQLLDAAFENNEQIASREYEISASRASRQSVYSSMLPSADLNWRYTRLGEVPYLAFPEEIASMMPDMGRIEMGRRDNYNLSLTISQPIFTGLSLYRGVKLSNIDVEIKEIELRKTKSQVALEVKKSYYNLVRILSSLSAAEIAKQGIEAHHRDLENLFESGLIVKNDLLRAGVAISEMDLAIVRIEHARDVTKDNLEVLTGIEVEDIITDLPLQKLSFSKERAESLALYFNFDMQVADAGTRAARQNVGLHTAKLFPSIAVAGNYYYKNPTQDLRNDWEDSWDISILAQMNIFSWGRDIAKIREARYKEKSYRETIEYGRKMLFQGVNLLFLGIREAELSIEISEKSVLLAEENLRIVRSRFAAGDATNTDVLDAEASLYNARNNLIDAVCDHNTKMAELTALIGYIR